MDEVVEIATAPVESSTPETEQTHVAIAEQSAPAEPTAAPVPDETTLAGKTVDSLGIRSDSSAFAPTAARIQSCISGEIEADWVPAGPRVK